MEFELDFGTGEVVDISVSSSGKIYPPKNNKIALIDADTVIFGACVQNEYMVEEDVGVGEVKFEEVWYLNIDNAFQHAKDKIDNILKYTGCKDFELHFTVGRNSFRYLRVDPEYKANRLESGTRAPAGLYELKRIFCAEYPDKAFMWTEWEADDIVVFKKREHPEDYILCAVDKDVLYTLAGEHFNYYSSSLHNIDMKFIEVDEKRAIRHHYIQVLMGDKGDNVIGLAGIGPAKAEKILGPYEDHKVLWSKVVEAYETKGRGELEAIKNMRLVNMHQLVYNDKKEIEVKLWKI